MARIAGEDGYTLAELLVVIAILGIVASAMFGLYSISQQVYTRAASLEDAQIGARIGLDRMATEIRQAGSYWTGAIGATTAISAATSTSITFRADVDADTVSGGAETTLTASSTSTTVTASGTATQVTGAFNVYADTSLSDFVYVADGAAREVRRISGVSGNTITLATALTYTYPAGSIARSVEVVTYSFDAAAGTLTRKVGGSDAEIIVGDVTGLTLSYYDTSGALLTLPPTLSLIREIEISLTTQGSDGSERTMTSRVRPRSLSFE